MGCVFDIHKCAVACVPRIVDRPIIVDCSVPAPPLPIPDCGFMGIPIPPGPPGCPEIFADGTVTVVQHGSGGGPLPPPSVTITVDRNSRPCDDECTFTFHFAFVIPVQSG